MSNRLTGQDVTIQLFQGDQLQDQLQVVKECTVTFEQSVSREDYLGERQQRPDGKFDIAKVEFAAHNEDAGWCDFIASVIARQMREAGAPTSFSMSCNLLYPNGQVRAIILSGLEFEGVSLEISGRKEMVNNSLTAYAEKHQFVN